MNPNRILSAYMASLHDLAERDYLKSFTLTFKDGLVYGRVNGNRVLFSLNDIEAEPGSTWEDTLKGLVEKSKG